MTEPPSGWTTPDEQPDDQSPAPPQQAPIPPTTPLPSGTPLPSTPGAPNWGPPPPGAQPGWGAPPPPGAQPAWGAPPPPGAQPGWGAPPAPGAQPGWGAPTGNWSTGGWSNRPGIIPLRPLTVGEILEGSVRAIRRNPRTMLGFSAIVIAVLALLAAAPQALAAITLQNSPLNDPNGNQNVSASDVAGIVGVGGLTVIVSVLQYVLGTIVVAALLIVAVDGAVRGTMLNPGQLWTRVRPRLLAVIGLALLVPLVFVLTMIVAVIPGVIVLVLPGGTALTVIGVILLVAGIFAGLAGNAALYLGFWGVAAPALLLENLGVFAALARSFRLVRGSFWRVFGILLLTGVMTGVLRGIVAAPFSLSGAIVGSADQRSFTAALLQLLISDIGAILAGAVFFPFATGVTALLYLDLRMRKEGLDVDLMRQ